MRQERFWSKVEFIPFHSCWEWKGAKNYSGYGLLYAEGSRTKTLRAHRVSYEIAYGPILDSKLVVCHRCDNPGCVRPEHLFLGTHKDNSQDMIKKNRGRGHFSRGALDSRSNGGAHCAQKTHCPHGHAYAGSNLAVYQGKRNCRICLNAAARRRRARRTCKSS